MNRGAQGWRGPLNACVAAVLLLFVGKGSGPFVLVGHTAIALLVDGHEAALAVDSLEGLGDSRRATARKQACKLRRVNGVAFAASGPIGYRTTAIVNKPDYELMDIAEKILRTEGPLKARLDRLDGTFAPIFDFAINDHRRPRGLLVPQVDKLIEMFFVASRAGRVEVGTRAYLPQPGPGRTNVAVYGRDCVLPVCEIKTAAFGGTIEAMDAALPTMRRSLTLPLKARRLIEAQIAATPQNVGPPVNIVSATRAGGVTWFARKDGCPADQ